ncbi:MAG TPA: aminopeptidase [Gemmatimonadales bacterium]|nr:aminopeptidase [Gemmatimonadales bacterium]
MSIRILIALVLLGALGCKDRSGGAAGTESAVVLPEGTESSAASARDYRPIAEKVVVQSAGVKEGEIVLLVGSDEDLPLLEDIAVEVRKRGASPLVTVGTNRLNRRMYDEVPAKYDSQAPETMIKLAGIVDVVIGTESGEGRTLQGVAPERVAARGKAGAPVGEVMRKRGVRTVFLGNGLYPSAERAEQFGISRDDLAEMMYSGVDADYAAIQAAGERVREALAAGKEIRITNPNGTDLRVRIEGRPITVNDGRISPEDRTATPAGRSVWLPAGDVILIPIPGTASGTIVSNQEFFRGERVTELRLDFQSGKVTSMSAKSGLEPLKAAYDAAGPGKDQLSVVNIGINPGVKVPEGNPIHVWSKAGTITLGIGNNTWASGDNQANFGISPSSPGSSLSIDGKVLIQDGKLLLPEKTASR